MKVSKIINATPHPIKFECPMTLATVEVPASGYTLFASPAQKEVYRDEEKVLVTTVYEKSEKGLAEIAEIWEKYGNDVIILGSIISAQAYAEEGVVSLVSVPGMERMKPEERLYCMNVFNTFWQY